MSTYVIGDIQGCYPEFQALLQTIAFNPGRDTLISAGDLINRGSDNLSTLRWFYAHQNCSRVVLGNHDLHLIAVHAGIAKKSKSDNLDDILGAADADKLIAYLCKQPPALTEGYDFVSHAGLLPTWSTAKALSLAAEVSEALAAQKNRYLGAMYGNEPSRWSDHLNGLARLRSITNAFTRMRYCTATGMLDLKSKGPKPDVAELDGQVLAPWFSHPHQLQKGERVFFGHWASLNGETNSEQFIGLDTGCVWGGRLSAYCLDSGDITSVPSQRAEC